MRDEPDAPRSAVAAVFGVPFAAVLPEPTDPPWPEPAASPVACVEGPIEPLAAALPVALTDPSGLACGAVVVGAAAGADAGADFVAVPDAAPAIDGVAVEPAAPSIAEPFVTAPLAPALVCRASLASLPASLRAVPAAEPAVDFVAAAAALLSVPAVPAARLAAAFAFAVELAEPSRLPVPRTPAPLADPNPPAPPDNEPPESEPAPKPVKPPRPPSCAYAGVVNTIDAARTDRKTVR